MVDRIVAGKLNTQIADELGIAERAVKPQRVQTMTKLQAGLAFEFGRLTERLQPLSDQVAASAGCHRLDFEGKRTDPFVL